MSTTTDAKPGRPLLKAFLVGLVLLVVTTGAIIALFGPAIAGVFASGAIERAVNPTIAGDVRVRQVRLSWGGPQRVGVVEVLDERGNPVGTFEGRAAAGLLAMARGETDLGEVTVTRTSAGVLDGATARRLASALRSTAPPTGEPMRLPAGLAGTFTLAMGDVSIAGETISDVRAEAVLTPGAPATLGVRAGSGVLVIDAEAPDLIGPDGALTFAGSGLSADVRVQAPARLVAALLGARADDEGVLRLDAALVEEGGVLTTRGNTPVRLRGRASGEVLARALGAPAGTLWIDGSPSGLVSSRELAIPMPDAAGAIDWRRLRAEFELTADTLSGRFARDGAPAPFSTEPIRGTLVLDEGGTLRAKSTTRVYVEGADAGFVMLDVTGTDLYTDAGAFAAGGPGTLRATLAGVGVPSALVTTLGPGLDDLQGVFGPSLTATVEATIADVERPFNGATLHAGQPAVMVDVQGEQGAALAHLVYDGARGVRTIGDRGVVVTTRRAGVLASRLLDRRAGVVVRGDASAELVVADAAVSLLSGGGLDTRAMAGTGELVITDLVARVGDEEPLDLDRLRVSGSLSGGSLEWSLGASMTALRRIASAEGAGRLDGLFGGALDVRGGVELDNVPTALASLAQGRLGALAGGALGETLSGSIATTPGSGGALRADLAGERGAITGDVRLAGGTLRLGGAAHQPFTITSHKPGGALEELLKALAGTPVAVHGAEEVSITANDVALDLGVDRAGALLRGIDADATLGARGLRVTIDGEAIDLDDGVFGVVLTRGGGVRTTIDVAGSAGGEAFALAGPLEITNLHDGSGAPDLTGSAWSAAIEGTAPVALVDLVPDGRVRTAAHELAGRGVVRLALETDERAARGSGGVRLTAASPRTGMTLSAPVGPIRHGLFVGDITVTGPFTPRLVEEVVAPLLEGTAYAGVRLRERVAGRVDVSSFTLPLKDGLTPDFPSIGRAMVRLSTEGDTVFEGVVSPWDGSVRSLGARDLTLRYTYYPQTSTRTKSAGVSGRFYDPSRGVAMDATALALRADAELPLRRLIGAVSASGDSAQLDGLLGSGDTFELALGGQYRVDLAGRALRRESEGAPFTLRVQSDRLTADVGVWRTEAGGYAVREPGVVGWAAPAELVTALLLGERERASGLSFADDVRAELRIDALTLGPAPAPLERGVFNLEGLFSTSPLNVADAGGGVERLGAYNGRVRTLADGTVGFDLTGEREVEGPRPGNGVDTVPTLTARGTLRGLSDGDGLPTPGAIRLGALELEGSLPTRLVDALAQTDGLLTALVGPDTRLDASVTGERGQTIRASFAGSFASGSMGGVMADGVFEVPEARVSVTRVSDAASRRLLGTALPMFTSFEKTAGDEPAVVTTSGLRLPLDGDLANLDGTITIDPGTMRFATRPFFGRLLELADNRAQGHIGRRIEPIVLRIEAGVVRYDDVLLPLGEFDVVIDGRVNLKSRRINTLVWVPFESLSDDLARAARRVPGVGSLTRVPLRVLGPIDSPSVDIDPEALLEAAPDALLESILDRLPGGGGGLFRDLRRGGGGGGNDGDR